MTSDALAIQLSFGVAAEFGIVTCRLAEGMSERTHAVVEIASHEVIDFEPILGEDATLILDGLGGRRWSLKLGRAAFLSHTDSSLRYRLDLYDPAWLLGHSTNTRKFRNKSAQEIVAQVLDDGRVAHRWAITSAPPVRKYCSQYRETNLAFVERLLEFEGIYYTFDTDGVMVLGDTSEASPRVRSTPFEIIEAAGALARGEVGIHALRKGRRVRSGRITLGDHNWKRPNLPLCESRSADRDSSLERFEYPAGYRLPEQGARLAQMRLEAERVQASFIQGKGNDPSFAPGHAISMGSHSGDMFAGDYLLLQVEHFFNNGEFRVASGVPQSATETTYENRFVGAPLAAKFRPVPRTPRPRVGGTHSATVRGPAGQEVHTDRYGRFRAQFHWDRAATETDHDSRWLRALQETSTSMTLARTGWEVFVGYIDGDPDRPIGLGRAINGIATPTYALPGNKNVMTVQTPSVGKSGGYNELKMDDSAGSQVLSVRAEKDLDALVKNDKTEKIGHNEAHSVGTDLTRQVAEDQTLTIGHDATARYGAEHKITIAGNRRKVVGGDEVVKIGKSAQTKTGGDEQESVGSLRSTVAGAIKPPDFKAIVDRARSLGIGLVKEAAPGLAAAYESAQSIRNKIDVLQEGGPDALIAGVVSAGQAGARAAASAVLGGTEQENPAAAAANAAVDAAIGGGSAQEVGHAALRAGVQALMNRLDPDAKPDAPAAEPSGAGSAAPASPLDAAVGAAQQSIQTTIERVLPTQKELSALIPSESWLPTEETFKNAFEKARANALEQIRQQLNIEAVINNLCHGGIARSATASMYKTVGSAYITVAVLGIDTRIGYGLVETIGGMKLTAARQAIREQVTGRINVIVGGAIRRQSATSLVISAGTNSSVDVGPRARYKSDDTFDVLGKLIELCSTKSLSMNGGGAEISFEPGAATLKGKVKLKAGKAITLIGGGKLNVT